VRGSIFSVLEMMRLHAGHVGYCSSQNVLHFLEIGARYLISFTTATVQASCDAILTEDMATLYSQSVSKQFPKVKQLTLVLVGFVGTSAQLEQKTLANSSFSETVPRAFSKLNLWPYPDLPNGKISVSLPASRALRRASADSSTHFPN
jgi:hypothetical protein